MSALRCSAAQLLRLHPLVTLTVLESNREQSHFQHALRAPIVRAS